MATVTLSPLIRLTVLEDVIFLEINNVLSSKLIPSSSKSERTFSSSIENVNSTSANSASFRIISFAVFPPSAILIEPIIIDFPAPVSPVNTFRCSAKSTSTSSMIARFFTCKFSNNFSLLPQKNYKYFILQFLMI